MKNNYIGLMVDDTPALVVGLLGILKSGNTFVPVNPVFPGERIHFIISDCNIKVLVTDSANYSRALQIARESSVIRHLLCIDRITSDVIHRHTFRTDTGRLTENRGGTQSPCYVIYTSGSTGRPKGVPITHRNLVPLLQWFCDYFQLGEHTRIMHNLSYTFDFGVFELLTTLISGGSMYMLDKKEVGDFSFYNDFIAINRINTMHTTPAFFSSVVSTGKKMPSLEIVHLGGENLSGGLVARISEQVSETCRIYNGYGPTEATINCSIHLVTPEQKEGIAPGESIPIGKPSAHNRIYIFDKYLRLQPEGVPGELCVAGEGLADGYLNRPELTAERFYRSYRSDRTYIFYRTGDLARWLPDGSIEYLGRIDRQVKIRGFRIELGEIENCLLKNNAVKDAVVTARQDESRSQRYLCAYIVPRDVASGESPTVSELREYLLNLLPDYMVPAYFIKLDEIPLTPNGKIDRGALPEPSQADIMTGPEYEAPENAVELKMSEIWQEILGVERIGRSDDFFEFGGDSILATQCIARIRDDFKVDISLRKMFERPSVKALSKEVTACKKESLFIKKAPRNIDIPLSFPQERLFFLQNLGKNSMAYFVPRAIRFIGKLNIGMLERTFTELLRRHEILRTVFPIRGGKPVQIIRESYPFKIPVIDFSGLDEKTQSHEVLQWISREGQLGFDFENGPMLRVSVLKLKEEEHIVVLTEHHLVHDGWTQGVLLREFITLFTAFMEGKPSPLPELPIQYADFAYWQRNYMQGEILEYHLDYWREKLAGLLPVLALPTDFPRPAVISGRGKMKMLTISPELAAALKKFSKEEGTTLYMTMLAVFKVFLVRYTGVEDLCVGAGMANRRLKEIEGMLGMVINTVALRTQVSSGLSFRDCLQRVKQTCLEAYEHGDTPFEKVVEALRPDRNLSYNPLFQVTFTFMDVPAENLELPGLELILEDSHNRTSKFDLNLVLVPPMDRPGEGELLIEWEYNTDLFVESTIDRMFIHYRRLLEEVIISPDQSIFSMTMLDEIEKKELIELWNHTEVEYPENKTIHELFTDQVRKVPDRVAVTLEHSQLTYRSLGRVSDSLAGELVVKGIKIGDIVALIIEPSIEMMTGILGILKAGGTYLPIDPDYPTDRIKYMLEDSQAPVLVTGTSNIKGNHWLTVLRERQVPGFQAFRTRSRSPITDFDSLPIPDRSMVDYEKYSRYIGQGMVKNSISLQGTRGCPYHCAYCHKIWPKKHVVRSAENIFDEVQLYYNMGIKRFVIIDDIFNLDKANSTRFFKLIIRKGLKLQLFFPNGVRGDLLTKDDIDLMVEAGTTGLAFALETASPRLQKMIRKHLNIDKLRENIMYCCEKYPQVILELFTMHGFPSETEEEAMLTLDFIKSLKWIDFPYVHILKIYPNTDMEKLAVENGISQNAIAGSVNLAYHELPETLPFDKNFTLKYQADFLNKYFLSRERLLNVLPYQLKALTRDELVKKYDSYLPVDLNNFDDLLDFVGIAEEELNAACDLDDDSLSVPGLNKKISDHFTGTGVEPAGDGTPLRILLLDLSQYFTEEGGMLFNLMEPPLGLMYIMTYLKEQLGGKVKGKIAKSRLDFDDYKGLKRLLDEFRPDVIGIRTLTFYKDFFHRTVSMIRHWGFVGPIIAGGPYATSDYASILQDSNVNLVVLGEGEHTFVQLIREIIDENGQLPREAVLKEIPGIAYVPGKARSAKPFGGNREIIFMDASDDGVFNDPLVLNRTPKPGDPAYIIYTSGTTGKPKGVIIDHRNVVRLLFNGKFQFNFSENDVWTLFHSYCFDFSVWEMYGALLYGGKMVVVPRMTARNTPQYLDVLKKEKVTVLNQTPSAFYNLSDEELKTAESQLALRYIIFGGEALSPLRLKGWKAKYPHVKLINMYGITETTVHVTYKEITYEDIEFDRSNIGQPIPTLSAYIVNREMQLVPVGVVGELLVGGRGVARGYLNRLEFTAERFIDNPYKPGERLYISGDLVKMTPNGDMEYAGRIDLQVKIRGYRVELGEIESRLLKHYGILEVVVLAGEDNTGDKYLCAYITAADETQGTPGGSELRNYLAQMLPGYMIPTYFVPIKKIPLTGNGKIDTKALPSPLAGTGEEDITAPRNAIEEKLVEIWSEVLGIEREFIGIDANFFELGGHSLKINILIAKLHKEFNVKIELADVFMIQTIRELAEYITVAEKDIYTAVELAPRKQYYELSPAQKRLYFQNRQQPDSTNYNMPMLFAMEDEPHRENLESTFKKLIARHESLRTSFDMVDKDPVQRVHAHVAFAIEYYDLKKSPVLANILKNFVRPFDLSRPPMLRVGLVKEAEKKYIIMMDMHHIVTDGISQDVLTGEFAALYAGRELPPLRLQYKDYSEWYNSFIQSDAVMRQKEYWLKQFEDSVPVLDLPIDFPRPVYRDLSGARFYLEIEESLVWRLKKMVIKADTTLFTVLLAAYTILLARLCGKEDIVVGTPVTGRTHADLHNIIGLFINMIPLRNQPWEDRYVYEFLDEVKNNTIKAFENQDFQFDQLVKSLNIERIPGRHPLFDTVLALQNFGSEEIDRKKLETLGNLKPIPYRNDELQIHYDLLISIEERDQKLNVMLEYSVALFKQDTINDIWNYFIEILEQISIDSNIQLKEIRLSHDVVAITGVEEEEGDFTF